MVKEKRKRELFQKIKKRIKAYFVHVLTAIDQLANAALLFGHEDETVSARCYRWHLRGYRTWPMRIVDFFAGTFFFDKNHCERCYNNEQTRRDMAPEYRPITSEKPKEENDNGK